MAGKTGTIVWITGSPGNATGYAKIIYSSDGSLHWQDQTTQLLKERNDINMYKIRFLKTGGFESSKTKYMS